MTGSEARRWEGYQIGGSKYFVYISDIIQNNYSDFIIYHSINFISRVRVRRSERTWFYMLEWDHNLLFLKKLYTLSVLVRSLLLRKYLIYGRDVFIYSALSIDKV